MGDKGAGMKSIKEIYRAGVGPSSSHTMGPRRAAQLFLQRNQQAAFFKVILFSSLAATGKGHLTDKAISEVFEERDLQVEWEPQQSLPEHPNGMHFLAYDDDRQILDEWEVYSIGGGTLLYEGKKVSEKNIYPETTMREIKEFCQKRGLTFWEYVEIQEGPKVWTYLEHIWEIMQQSIEKGLETEGVLPGPIGLPRKANYYFKKVKMTDKNLHRSGLLSAYALAVSEENAAGGYIVTAPTCGSCGIMPAILKYLQEVLQASQMDILKALATAGLVGNLVKQNASISGAKVGCQGEVGTACAMAAAAAVQLMGASIHQIEYAAEMGLEHHLGLTCDPVFGMVQIPCIERNVFAAKRALSCAEYAWFSDGSHRITFDDVVEVMNRTGVDLNQNYRETALGGLAAVYFDRLT